MTLRAQMALKVERTAATGAVRRGLSRHFPVPVAILARLAVDRRDQGEGLGAALLDDALRRQAASLGSSASPAVRARRTRAGVRRPW